MPGRKKKEESSRIKFLTPEEVVLSIKVTTASKRLSQVGEKVEIRKEKKKERGKKAKEKKKKAKKPFLSLEEKKKEVGEFQLPSIKILTAYSDVPPKDMVEKGPYSPPGVSYTRIYITKDKKYLVIDPVVSDEMLEDMQKALSELFFLTESESIARALREEDVLDKLLASMEVRPEVAYLIKRELFGYGLFEPLIRDPDIEDFQVPGIGVPAKVLHREYGPLETNIILEEDDLNRYIEKFVAKTGHSISLYMPLASLQLPEGHRLTVAYSREVTTRGPALVVRKFPEKPWSISMILAKNTMSPEMAAWLMIMVEAKKGMMIVGPMGSGKTSVMNAICNFIPREATIVTIEDTPELRLSHPYWIQHKTRESLTMEGKGSITMFDLVKHALRESADYMIVGEVRGEEGRVWAQAISTGHGGITTFHAESPEAMIARLTSPPISVEKGLLTALRTIVTTGRFIKKIEVNGKVESHPIRRVTAIYDYHYDPTKDEDVIQQVFKYNPIEDNFQLVADLTETPTAKIIIEEKGITPEEFLDDYNQRVRLFKRLKEHIDNALKLGGDTELLEYDKVTELLWLFREDPEKAIEYIDTLDSRIRGATQKEAGTRQKPGKTEMKEEKPKRKIRFIGIEEDKSD